VALGVIPWLHSPREGVAEMARVLKPGGRLIVNADNAARLTHRLDPKYNPGLAGAREALKGFLGRTGLRRPHESPPWNRHTPAEFEDLLAAMGLDKVRGCTIGFGPFSFLDRPLLPNRLDLKLDQLLQSRADRGAARLRPAGVQYLVIARKAEA
jgi:SAM-dependent methyltransferase